MNLFHSLTLNTIIVLWFSLVLTQITPWVSQTPAVKYGVLKDFPYFLNQRKMLGHVYVLSFLKCLFMYLRIKMTEKGIKTERDHPSAGLFPKYL